MTMYFILWRCRPLEGQESGIVRAYGPSGEWALLVGRDEGSRGTELRRRPEDSREYLTLDRWVSRAAYETFHSRFSSEYRRLDDRSEELTEEETPLGAFEVLP